MVSKSRRVEVKRSNILPMVERSDGNGVDANGFSGSKSNPSTVVGVGDGEANNFPLNAICHNRARIGFEKIDRLSCPIIQN